MRQSESVLYQYGIDGQVRCPIPEADIAYSTAAMMAESAVQDLMRQHCLELCRLEQIGEGRVVENATPVGGHRGHPAGNKLEPKT